MSPKIATITLALLSLTLSLTLSSAQTDCPPGFNTIPDVLKHYGLPPAFFPDDVKDFSCYDVPDKHALGLSINLKGVCTVTRGVPHVFSNALTCQPQISATVSLRQLTDIKGVTVKFSVLNIVLGGQTVTGVKVFDDNIQFFGDDGASPVFPIRFIPPEPPKCDLRPRSIFDYSASSAKTNQYTPNYGVLLPFIV